MVRRKKQSEKDGSIYSKNESFEELKAVQQMALNKRGKDDEINPDISAYLKAEELKGKLCGLYSEKESVNSSVNVMGSVKINGEELQLEVGEKPECENDRIT